MVYSCSIPIKRCFGFFLSSTRSNEVTCATRAARCDLPYHSSGRVLAVLRDVDLYQREKKRNVRVEK